MRMIIWIFLAAMVTSCTHTVQGMRTDIREATGPDQTQVVEVKRTTTVYPSTAILPTNPPPLQTPPR